jgi:starch-binding outer membrane protein, SusD/RagB family
MQPSKQTNMKTTFKNKFKAIVPLVVLSFAACDLNRLDTPPLSLTEETFLTRESEYNELLFNAYAKMTDWYWFAANNPKHAVLFLPGDDVTEPQGRYAMWESFNNINPTEGFVRDFYRSTYEMIQRANTVVEKTAEGDPGVSSDPQFLTRIKGEGHFLRALAYFKLFNMFGAVPLITERLNIETIHQPRSTGTQILDQCVADLQEAVNLLPASWPASDRGRATKNSAYGLLVKVLVFRGDYSGNAADYSAAVQAFSNITASLTPDYTDNFSAFKENNQESLFEFQASAAPNQDNVWRGVEVMSTYWGFYSKVNGPQLWNRPGAQWRVTRKMFNAYGTDPRISFFTEPDRSFTKYGKEGLDKVSPGDFIPGSMNNVRILRYADIKLLAAEALLLSGGSKSTAIAYINDIRQRARNWATTAVPTATLPQNRDTGETNSNIIMAWIEEERAIELLGEEQIRWFDLKRWDARGYKSLQGWTGSDAHFSTDLSGTFGFEYPKHLLLPLPQDEIVRNNQISDNNPGY